MFKPDFKRAYEEALTTLGHSDDDDLFTAIGQATDQLEDAAHAAASHFEIPEPVLALMVAITTLQRLEDESKLTLL